MPYDVTLLVVYTLALASATRLVTGMDTLTEIPQRWAVAKIWLLADWSMGFFDTTRWSAGWFTVNVIRGICWFIGKMIDCYWCAPFWIAALMLWGYDYWLNPVALFVALALAMRFVAGSLISVSR